MPLKNKRIDLHIHSLASDGSLSPKEIIQLALEKSLYAISITDHDTIDGTKEALKEFPKENLKFITGLEISSTPPDNFLCLGSFHILAYGIDIENQTLINFLKTHKKNREERNKEICKKLEKLNCPIDFYELQEKTKGVMGRPHIAEELLKKKFVRNIEEAFIKYLRKGSLAYVRKETANSSSAIKIILEAKGIPVLAHPNLLKLHTSNLTKGQSFEKLILSLKEQGLMGIEAYYTSHSKSEENFYKEIAKKNQLLITGGSDFHGDFKKDIKLGKGYGNLFVPSEIYDNLLKCLTN